MNKEVIIYTDGACSGNPGPGGWGTILMYKDTKKEISGGNPDTTNNVMEITAVIEGLKLLKEPCKVQIYSDSAYVVNAFNQHWIENWIKKNWQNSKKEPVKNKELWLELYALVKQHEVKFIKVKGHSDNEFNNRCDELARGAIQNISKKITMDEYIKEFEKHCYNEGIVSEFIRFHPICQNALDFKEIYNAQRTAKYHNLY